MICGIRVGMIGLVGLDEEEDDSCEILLGEN